MLKRNNELWMEIRFDGIMKDLVWVNRIRLNITMTKERKQIGN